MDFIRLWKKVISCAKIWKTAWRNRSKRPKRRKTSSANWKRFKNLSSSSPLARKNFLMMVANKQVKWYKMMRNVIEIHKFVLVETLVLQRLKCTIYHNFTFFFVVSYFCLRIVCSNCLFLFSNQNERNKKRRFLMTQKQQISGLKIKKKTNQGNGRGIAFCSLFSRRIGCIAVVVEAVAIEHKRIS